MTKRTWSGELVDCPPTKRFRLDKKTQPDILSSLSDEIILHILSFLSTPSLIICQRLSRRFRTLAADSELWKRQYYSRWVLPRTRLLGGSKNRKPLSSSLYSPKVSNWLGHGHLAEHGRDTNWQGKYRLRHNWSKGICRVREVAVSHLPSPPVLVKLYAGIVFTADRGDGLRAWLSKQPQICFARTEFSKPSANPTSISACQGSAPYEIEICIGFEDGHFGVYGFDRASSAFVLRCSSALISRASITAIASSSPYLVLISGHKTMSLCKISYSPERGQRKPPEWLTSLEASNILAPVSLYLRKSGCNLIASMAYSFYHIGCGWCIGIQEVHLGSDGNPSRSRLVTSIDSFWDKYTSELTYSLGARQTKTSNISSKTQHDQFSQGYSVYHRDPPTSISYSHPYLLTSHSDNTLTMYLVVSSADDLTIKRGRRLWGHTSSVSTVQVSDRGKAVSVSAKGEEIRIWELETMVGSENAFPRNINEENSVQVSPERRAPILPLGMRSTPQVVKWSREHLSSTQTDTEIEAITTQDWVGFDEERVVLLRQLGQRPQFLECYDFT